MDLSAEGNVFGLDESLQPDARGPARAPDRGRRTSDGVRDTGGRVTLAIHALPKPVIAAINGAGRRHRRHHDAGDGHPAGLDQGPDRLRLRPARHRARGGVELVPAAHRRASSRRWSGSTPPTSSTAEQALRRPPGALGARARRPAAGGATTWPARSSSTAPRSRSAWPSSCSTATARRPTRSRRTCPTRWRCSTPRSGDGKEGVAAFREKRTPRLHRPRLASCRRLRRPGPHCSGARARPASSRLRSRPSSRAQQPGDLHLGDADLRADLGLGGAPEEPHLEHVPLAAGRGGASAASSATRASALSNAASSPPSRSPIAVSPSAGGCRARSARSSRWRPATRRPGRGRGRGGRRSRWAAGPGRAPGRGRDSDRGDPGLRLLDGARRPDDPAVVAEVAAHLTTDGRDGVAQEVGRPLGVEAAHGLDQPEVGDLLEVVDGDATTVVATGDLAGHAHVEPDDLLLDGGPVGLGRRLGLEQEPRGLGPAVRPGPAGSSTPVTACWVMRSPSRTREHGQTRIDAFPSPFHRPPARTTPGGVTPRTHERGRRQDPLRPHSRIVRWPCPLSRRSRRRACGRTAPPARRSAAPSRPRRTARCRPSSSRGPHRRTPRWCG